jgi:hypothetical protein
MARLGLPLGSLGRGAILLMCDLKHTAFKATPLLLLTPSQCLRTEEFRFRLASGLSQATPRKERAMRTKFIITLQAVLVIAAISALPEPASARCSCTCAGAHGQDIANFDLPRGSSCSTLNGRSCSLPAQDPAGQRAGITASARLRDCTGFVEPDDLFKSRK